jgi:hypothetical protein
MTALQSNIPIHGVRLTDADVWCAPSSATTQRTPALSDEPDPRISRKNAYAIKIISASEPAWIRPTTTSLLDLLDLPPDWDSYGANVIDRSQVFAALAVLCHIMQHESPLPTVVPTNTGGVQLEWHTRGIDLEIETVSMNRILVLFEDADTGSEWEKEFTVDDDGNDLALLADCVARLST